MHWLLALTVVTALPPPVSTHPGFVDAAQLAAVCTASGPDAAVQRALCLGYVTGVTDHLLARSPGRRPPSVCPPPDLTPKAALDAVMLHVRFATNAKGIGAADFVRFALERAYPCPIDRSRR